MQLLTPFDHKGVNSFELFFFTLPSHTCPHTPPLTPTVTNIDMNMNTPTHIDSCMLYLKQQTTPVQLKVSADTFMFSLDPQPP